MLGSSLWWFAQHPAARRRLAEDRGLWPSAVEELLRRFAPATAVSPTETSSVTTRTTGIRSQYRLTEMLEAGDGAAALFHRDGD